LSRRFDAAPSADALITLAAYRLQADAVPLPSEAPDCVVAKNQHGSYCVPRSSLHRPAARAVVNAGVWESKTLDFLRSAGRDGDIVHAGTFFGDFIPALARSRERDACVWAFEPNRESYECARLTVVLNDLENVMLSHAGLSAESATALLATRNAKGLPLSGGSHLVLNPARAPGIDNEQVDLVAVDDIVSSDRRVAVIQLDVEGHEQEALTGAMRTITRWRPLIVLETVPPQSWIAEHLAPLGYRVAGNVDANTVLRQR
jgi:FkbM family methyltransferase